MKSQKLYFFLALLVISVFTFVWNSPALYKRIEMLDESTRNIVMVVFDPLIEIGLIHKIEAVTQVLTKQKESEEFLVKTTAPIVSEQNTQSQNVDNKDFEKMITELAKEKKEEPPIVEKSVINPELKIEEKQVQKKKELIAFVGDSFANGYARAAKRIPIGYSFKDFGHHSTGLVVKSYYDWVAETQRVCNEAHPSVFIFAFGANDSQDMKTEKGYLRFGSEAWKTEYTERAMKIVSIAKSCGAKVAWLTLPPMREPRFERNMVILRSVQDPACQMTDACVPPPEEFGQCCSAYSNTAKIDGKTKLIRNSDGIHPAMDGDILYVSSAYKMLGLGIDAMSFTPSLRKELDKDSEGVKALVALP